MRPEVPEVNIPEGERGQPTPPEHFLKTSSPPPQADHPAEGQPGASENAPLRETLGGNAEKHWADAINEVGEEGEVKTSAVGDMRNLEEQHKANDNTIKELSALLKDHPELSKKLEDLKGDHEVLSEMLKTERAELLLSHISRADIQMDLKDVSNRIRAIEQKLPAKTEGSSDLHSDVQERVGEEALPMHKLDRLQTNNRTALDNLESLLNEHPELRERYRAQVRILNEQHSSLDVLLGGDPIALRDITADPESKTLTHQALIGIGNSLKEIEAAIEADVRGKTEVPSDQPGPRETSDTTQRVTSDSPLARQAEKSGFGKDEACMQHLARIDEALETVERARPAGSLRGALREIKTELSTALEYCRNNDGIEPSSLSRHIQKITGFADRLLSPEQAPESLSQEELKKIAGRLRGLSAELSCANQITKNGEASSFIVLGATGTVKLTDKKTGEQITVSLHPVGEADIIYRDTNWKVRIEETKSSADAFNNTLKYNSEQFKKLDDWQSDTRAKEPREAIVVIQSLHNWSELMRPVQGTGYQTAFDALTENKLALKMGDDVLNTSQLKGVKRLAPVHRQLAQQTQSPLEFLERAEQVERQTELNAKISAAFGGKSRERRR